jgi:hypothetical protein
MIHSVQQEILKKILRGSGYRILDFFICYLLSHIPYPVSKLEATQLLNIYTLPEFGVPLLVNT